MAEQIIVEFIPNTSAISDATDELSAKEKETLDAGNASITKRNQLIKENLTQYANGLKAASAVTDAFKKQMASAKTVKDQVIGLANAMDAAFQINGAEGLNEVFVALNGELQKSGVSMETFLASLKEADPELSVVAEKTDTARKRLADMREELITLRQAGKENTEQYRALSIAAGELDDTIKDVNDEFASAGSDTKGLDNMVRGLSLVTASFGLVQGVMSTFGDDNEELEKALIKVNGLMLVLSSLTTIQTELKRADNVVTVAKIGLQKLWTVAVGETAGAMRALRVAMAGLGIGLIIAAVALLITKLIEFTSATDDATLANKHFKDSLDDLNGAYNEANERLEHNTKLALENAKQQGASADELYKIQANANKKRISNDELLFQALQKRQQDLRDETSKTYKEFGDNDEERLKATQEVNAQLVTASSNLNKSIMSDEEQKQEFITSQYEKNVEAAEKAAEQAKAITERNTAARQELETRSLQYIADLRKKEADDEALGYPSRLASLRSFNEAALQVIEINRQAELAKADLTATEKLNINDKFNTERDRQDAEYLDQRAAMEKAAAIKEVEDTNTIRQAGLETQLAQVRKGTRDELDIRNQLIRAKAEADIASAANTITNQTVLAAEIIRINAQANAAIIANNSDFNAERLRQQGDYQKSLHDLQIAQNNTDAIGASETERFKINQANQLILHQETLSNLKALDAQYNSGQITDLQAYLTKRNELTAKSIDETNQMREAEKEFQKKQLQDTINFIAEATQKISDSIFDFIKQSNQQALDDKLNNLQRQQEAELAATNLTEQQKKNIEARYAAQELNAKRQAAQKDKQASIAQALINGALAVTKALASSAPPFNFINAALVGVATAIQIAKIRSTPLPAYAKGTKNAAPGYAWTGEEGPELIKLKGGEQIYTAAQSKRMAADWSALPKSINLDRLNKPGAPSGMIIDYSKLGKEVGKNIPKFGLDINENGFKKWVIAGNKRTTYLNTRYKD